MKLTLILIAIMGLTACYEDTDVTLHEAGEYKGSPDRHAKTPEQRAEILKLRFNQVQTDR
ncbi:hypothetical protein [Methylophaga sp.]|uniref:hypothetical protein n=1 Tax=Methylophaga sp. TaxID=2024840 RepID=UPI003F6A4F4C